MESNKGLDRVGLPENNNGKQEKGVEGIDADILQQAKNELDALKKIMIVSDDSGIEPDGLGVEEVETIGEKAGKENGVEGKKTNTFRKKAALSIAVLVGLTLYMVKDVEARGLFTDILSVATTGRTPRQNKAIEKANESAYREAASQARKSRGDAARAQNKKVNMLNKAQEKLMAQEIEAIENGPGTFDEKNAALDELAQKYGM